MPKIRVIKHGGFKYGLGAERRQYGKGEELIVKQKEARLYVAAKPAEEVPAQSTSGIGAAPKPKARTTAARTAASGTRKGTYNRRDMKAK